MSLQALSRGEFLVSMTARKFAFAAAGVFLTLAVQAGNTEAAIYLAIVGVLFFSTVAFYLHANGAGREWVEYYATVAVVLSIYVLLRIVPVAKNVQALPSADPYEPSSIVEPLDVQAETTDLVATATDNGHTPAAEDPRDRPYSEIADGRPARLCPGARLSDERIEDMKVRCQYECSAGGTVVTVLQAPLRCAAE